MELRILGPVEVHRDRQVTVPRRRLARLLLGTLALRSNLAVSRDDLADALWERQPPPSAPANLRSYATELRRLLGPRTTGPSIEAAGGGYRLRVGPADLDALRFEEFAGDGRRLLAAGDFGAASDRLARALAAWRGEVLGGLSIPALVADDVRRLEDRWLATTEDSLAAQLALGHHTALVSELETLVGRYPTHERLWGQLMLALYRSGRQADALLAYRRLYQVLADELGVEPGPDSREMHRRILRADPDLRLRESVRVRPVPWQLPPGPTHFTGHPAELARLDAIACPVPRGSLSVALLTGTAGVGKTALALHWSHSHRDRFPDGCLYADLRGYSDDRPRSPDDVLADFLRALDAAGGDPSTGRYRTELSGRRMLVILDNACTAEQVRPLLPGDSATVLVTSRDALAGLVVADGAHRITVGRLPDAEAAELLNRLIGRRALDDPRAVAALARQCARLPLALRIGADLAALRPALALADLVDELTAERGRLDVLDEGGGEIAIRTVLSWSLGHVSGPVRRAFRLLGLHPGAHVDEHAIAALLGTPARAAVTGLLRAHLVEEVMPGRYASHDLLRDYARELAAAAGRSEPVEAVTRLLDQQLAMAARAMDLAYPSESLRRPRVRPAAGPDLADEAAARHWLDAETPNLLALCELAAARPGDGWHDHLVGLSATLQRHLHTGVRYGEALRISELAVHAAEERADHRAVAWARNDVALCLYRLGRYAEAMHQFTNARTVLVELGDGLGESVSMRGIGMVHYRMGRPVESLPPLSRSLELCRAHGDRNGEGTTLCNIGLAHEWSCDWTAASDCYRQALAIHRELGFLVGQGDVLNNLAIVYRQCGDPRRAAETLAEALAVYRSAGDRAGEGAVRNNLGLVHIQLGDWAAAEAHLAAGLALHRDIHHRGGELETLNIQAEMAQRRGRPEEALAGFRVAMALAVELAEPGAEMNAHYGLGHALLAAGQAQPAGRHFRSAVEMARASGARSDEARALAGLARCTRSPRYRRQAAAIYRELGIAPADQGRIP